MPSLASQVPTAQFRLDPGAAAISYTTRNDLQARKYFLQPMCGGVAVLDFDNDGQQDLFFTNGAKLPSMKKTSSAFDHCLLRNRGKSGWQDVTAKAGLLGRDLGYALGVAAGDYDNDGFTDLFVAGAGPNALYHNEGNGTFTQATAKAGVGAKPDGTLSVGGAWLDYDRDGLLDLFVSNYTIWSPALDQACVDPVRGPIYCSPTRYPSVPNQLFRNLGHGKFLDVSEEAGVAGVRGKGMGVSIADFNEDGHSDVLVVNDTERNFLYLNQGDGTFRERAFVYGVAFNEDGVTVNGMGSDAKDFDNDGFVDVFYNNLAGQVWALFLNAGGRSFRYASPSTGLGSLSNRYGGWSAGFIDFDNDGWQDLYSANGDVDYFGDNARQSDTLFRNVEGKRLEDVSARMGAVFSRKGFHRGSAFGDFNGDGATDIVVTGLNEKPRVLLNRLGSNVHWIDFDLVGRVSVRDAIGAKIKITTASGRVLHNHVAPSVGFLSSSEKRVHFGLGREMQVTGVEIRWPSGTVQTVEVPGIDRIVRVDEVGGGNGGRNP